MEHQTFLRWAVCMACVAALLSFPGCPPEEEVSPLVGVWKVVYIQFCTSMLPHFHYYTVALHGDGTYYDGTAEIVTDEHAAGTWSNPFNTNDISMSFPSINLGLSGTINGNTMSGIGSGDICWSATKVEF